MGRGEGVSEGVDGGEGIGRSMLGGVHVGEGVGWEGKGSMLAKEYREIHAGRGKGGRLGR